MSDPEEERLIARLRRRDEAAFSEFVRTYQARVFQLVFRMVGDRAEAEDLSQEVFVAVFKAIDSFRGEAKLSTWLYRIATNHCRNRIKYLARRARVGAQALDEIEPHADFSGAQEVTSGAVPRPDELAQARQTERTVREALAELDTEHRELIVLRDIENLSYEEILGVTGLPEGTVKSRLHRARAALQRRVSELEHSRRKP